jgi:hypothetical protein
MPYEALTMLRIPDHTRRAGGEIGLVHPVSRTAAPASSTATASCPAASSASSSTAASASSTASRKRWRSKGEVSDQQSRAERRSKASGGLKTRAHRSILLFETGTSGNTQAVHLFMRSMKARRLTKITFALLPGFSRALYESGREKRLDLALDVRLRRGEEVVHARIG